MLCNRTCSPVIFTYEFVALRLPWRWLFGCRVELVVEQAECLLAAESVAREMRAIARRELNFDVHAIRGAPLDERRPQPIVDVIVRHIADHVAPPIDLLVEICVRLLHPLQQKTIKLLFYSILLYDKKQMLMGKHVWQSI